jgi:hypothetical protein
MSDQNERSKWELIGGWFGNIANLAAVLSLLFLMGLAVPKYAESAPDKLSILINEINEYALRDVQDNRAMRTEFVTNLFSVNKELTADQIAQIYKEEYAKLKELSKKETMTTARWFVLWGILGISFVGFMVLVCMGYKDKDEEGMSKGDLRKAIAVFLIVLFGSLVVSSYFPIGVNVPSEIQGIFAGAVATVIGFYFGSRASEPSAGGAKPPVIPKPPVDPKPPVGPIGPKPPGGPKPLDDPNPPDDPKPSGGK